MHLLKLFIKYSLCIVLILFSFEKQSYGQQVLQTKLSDPIINDLIINIDQWRIGQKKLWLNSILKLPELEKSRIIKQANLSNSFTWPSLLSSKYLEYKTNGNRTNYEDDVNMRRATLSQLVIGELVEGKKRFIPQIANGIWLMLEESTWVSPAHIVVQKAGSGLPDPADQYIDLGAGRVGADIAMIYFLLKDQLDLVSPLIRKKIEMELSSRIINPYLERDDYWWMALRSNASVNNWNIWINTNVLKVSLLVESDSLKLKRILKKLIKSADKFIDSYPDDGACEEGPSYWMHAGGELGQMLSWIHSATQGKVDFKSEEKIHHMGEFILNAHISGDRYVNFADAESIITPYPSKIWIYGDIFDDSNLKSFASYLANRKKDAMSISNIQDFIQYTSCYAEMHAYSSKFQKNQFQYSPSLGQATLRNNSNGDGLFISAIGSNNGVSHNHNDVGSYMIYLDSLPILIDVGVGTYTKETFSSKRYSIWNMQSQWHNLPVINNESQMNGKAYQGTEVVFKKTTDGASYSLNIADAYPKTTDVASWKRNIEMFSNKNKINFSERYSLKEIKSPQVIHFISVIKPVISGKSLEFKLQNGKSVNLLFDDNELDFEIESKKIDDSRISKIWGDYVFRTKVILKSKKLTNKIKYSLTVN